MSYRAPLIGLLVAILLGVGFWFLLHQPLVEEQEDLEAETDDLEREADQLEAEIAELERIRDQEFEIRQELQLLEEYVPNEPAQPRALEEFQQIADESGTDFELLSFGQPVAIEDAPETDDPETTLAEITLSMTIEGGYFQIVDFLRRLEVEVPRAHLVESLTVSEGEDGFDRLDATWTGRIFAVVDVVDTAEPDEADPEDPDDEDPDDEDPDDEDPDDLEGDEDEGDVAEEAGA